MSAFQYEPLNVAAKEIRLVEIIDPPETSGPIHLRLKNVSLLLPFEQVFPLTFGHLSFVCLPRYYALSYTWGAPYDGLGPEWDDPLATHLIYINGAEFHVRWNLMSALQHFRQTLARPTLIWIDAICINQADVKEREQQVRQMKEIYASSIGTLIWLGPASDDSDLGMRALNEYNTAWEARSEDLRQFKLEEAHEAEYRRLSDAEVDPEGSKDRLLAIIRLFFRHWFHRAWVAQEVAVSPGSVIFCGSSQPVQWKYASLAYKLISQHYALIRHHCPEKISILPILGAITKAATNFKYIEAFHLSYRRELGPAELIDLLTLLRLFQTTDPRDKVYAALGFSSDANLVPIDYSSPADEVFISMTKNWIQRENNLHILDLCYPSSIEGLPSWVVDWINDGYSLRDPGYTLRNPLYKSKWRTDMSGGKGENVYSAGGDLPLVYRFEDDSKVLVLQGFPFDVITHTGRIIAPYEVNVPSLVDEQSAQQYAKHVFNLEEESKTRGSAITECSWLKSWLENINDSQACPMLSFNGVALESGELEDLALYRITYKLTGDPIRFAFFRTVTADIDHNDDTTFGGRVRMDSETGLPRWRNFTTSVTAMNIGRVVFASSSGYLGLAPESSQEGDLLCVIPGNETPLLLRPGSNGRMAFVGECYVHGIMDGVAIDMFSKEIDGERVLPVHELKIV
ncbi:MAG: hypothetical protein M1813_008620 [Trichoglossum hirsutum]|jgi:hypothetical protein|nr:MAG: hypothetical protein M1813_008620 [Trichoglossum hirsutum]